MSSTSAVVPQLQTTVDLEVLTSRWLRTLAPTTFDGYVADVRAWLTYVFSNNIDPWGCDLVRRVSTLDALALSMRARRVAGVGSLYVWLRDGESTTLLSRQ